MRLLMRYITYHLLVGIGLVLLLVFALQGFVLLMGEMKHLQPHYSILSAVAYVLCILPYQLYTLLPLLV